MAERTLEDVLKPFYYHTPPEAATHIMRELRDMYRDMARYMHTSCPESRSKSIALTHLEESCMRAIQALAIHSQGSEAVTD